jgi:opacity protein-like surface antigen
MKTRTTLLFSLAAAATLAMPVVARAQVSNPLKFTVFGGVALPTGDTGDGVSTGYDVGGAVDYQVPLSPLGIRGEVTYASFSAKDDIADDADLSDLGINANVVLRMPNPGSPVHPYLTAGPSFGRIKVSASSGGVDVSASENHFGFNVGGGIDFALGGLGTRLDARYRRISVEGGSIQYIPITFGITF